MAIVCAQRMDQGESHAEPDPGTGSLVDRCRLLFDPLSARHRLLAAAALPLATTILILVTCSGLWSTQRQVCSMPVRVPSPCWKPCFLAEGKNFVLLLRFAALICHTMTPGGCALLSRRILYLHHALKAGRGFTDHRLACLACRRFKGSWRPSVWRVWWRSSPDSQPVVLFRGAAEIARQPQLYRTGIPSEPGGIDDAAHRSALILTMTRLWE